MISIEGITVKLGNSIVLENIHLNLKKSSVYGLLGLNGSGKSTLFNTIYGFVKPSSGIISWEGKPIQKKHVAYLETENYFYPNITGEEYLSLFQQKSQGFKQDKWVDLFSLPIKRRVEEYSSGMKKKLAFLGLLKLDRQVFLLDEPFNGVDIETARVFEMVFSELAAKGKTLVVTSHILEPVTNTCDTIFHLEGKRISRQFEKHEFGLINNILFHKLETETKNRISEAL
jgi:ABC-2 type transport system ATP-binding protein